MDIRTLLVPMCGAPTDGALLEMSLGLARLLKAHVHAVFTRPEVSRLKDYLAAHGVIAISGFLPSFGKSTGKRLLEYAHEKECDHIVLGGFGHGRYREAIIGGTSRYMLNHAVVPLFLMA